jgi:hypothetical protein
MLSSYSFVKTYPLCIAVPELSKYRIQFEYENKMDVICIYEENSKTVQKKEFLSTTKFRGTIISCYLSQGITKNDLYIYDDLTQYCNEKKTMTCSVKLVHMKNIMEQYNMMNTTIILYLPVMWTNVSHENTLLSMHIPYCCHFIRFESLYSLQTPLTFSYDDVLRQKICIDLKLTDTCLEKKEEKNIRIFEVVPQCQPDIYFLYTRDDLGNSVFNSTACITSYKLSCEMNFIFRRIRNVNIDWIEESEDEYEAEDDSDSDSESDNDSTEKQGPMEKTEQKQRKKNKYNDIHAKYESTTCVFMKCYYHAIFDKWVPIQVY